MEISEIFKSTDEILLKELMFYDKAMMYAQGFGYNGFKRMFRVLTKKTLCWHIELENNLFDYHRLFLNAGASANTQNFSNIRVILESFKNMLATDLTQLAKLNQEHIAQTGISNCVIENMIKCSREKWNKVSRWITRFNETNWNIIEIHIVDDATHKKMKEYEEGEK